MRDSLLPILLLSSALGFALGHVDEETAWPALILMVVAGLCAAGFSLSGLDVDVVFNGVWLSLAVTAATVYLPQTWRDQTGRWLSFALALNAGLWAGWLSQLDNGGLSVALSVPLVLIMVPARALIARGWGIGIKVACSWLVAIALLAIGLNLVPTPGYAPDHME